KSDDRGKRWTAAGLTQCQGSDSNSGSARYLGPKMAIDPNNKDIVYVCNSTGVYFVTYNGGTTWHRVDAMLAALPNAKTTAATRVGSNATLTFSAVPAPVLKHLANSGGF